LLEALRDLRHAVERAAMNPEFARDGLSSVLDVAGSHLIQALKRHHNNDSAEVLARALSCTKVEGSISRESLPALLGTIDGLLMCLPFENHSPKKRKLMPLKEAEPKIREYLKRHPDATRPEVAKAVGCSEGTVQKSKPWKACVAARRAERGPVRTKIGYDVAVEEKSCQAHREAELDALVKDQKQDRRNNRVR